MAADPEESRYRSLRGPALAGLGRGDEAIREGRRARFAIAWLERTLALEGPITPAWLRVDAAWDSLREDPRFQRLLAR